MAAMSENPTGYWDKQHNSWDWQALYVTKKIKYYARWWQYMFVWFAASPRPEPDGGHAEPVQGERGQSERHDLSPQKCPPGTPAYTG